MLGTSVLIDAIALCPFERIQFKGRARSPNRIVGTPVQEKSF
jgi:hypothetical protein